MKTAEIVKKVASLEVETPSWGYADSGTRFGVFHLPGAAKTLLEKIEDAAQAHRFTGIAPRVALHIPWDKTSDYAEASRFAKSHGISFGAINPNLFQDIEYRFGSLGAEDKSVRAKALSHIRECVDIMREVDSKALSLWFADGTNFPGQGSFRSRFGRFADGLAEVHSWLNPEERMLIEYKPFEPAFYSTDIPDWGSAYILANKCGPRAKVLVDLGHHFHGVNIEQIVATLLGEGRLGGFHFNNRKYADDDLTTGSINPYELFLIFCELVAAENEGVDTRIDYMIDEMHSLKNKVAEMIQSLAAIQSAYAKALLVDWQALQAARDAEDLIGAEEVLKAAFETDVRPILTSAREKCGCPDPSNPVAGFLKSSYPEKMAASRG